MLDARMVTDDNFTQLVVLAEYLQAELLMEHLRAILAAHWRVLVTKKDFTTKQLAYRSMWQLLQNFPGSADEMLTILAHWTRDWDVPATDLHKGGTLVPLLRMVDISKVSRAQLAEAERTMPAAAFGELDAAVMFAELTAAESALATSQAELASIKAQFTYVKNKSVALDRHELTSFHPLRLSSASLLTPNKSSTRSVRSASREPEVRGELPLQLREGAGLEREDKDLRTACHSSASECDGPPRAKCALLSDFHRPRPRPSSSKGLTRCRLGYRMSHPPKDVEISQDPVIVYED
jgi:hypothetical protein